MPVYAYRCDHCGVQFEQHQSFSDEPLKVCPECSEPALRKLIQPVGIVFKGSGFYVTDNRSSSRSNGRSKAADSAEKKSESKSEAKSSEIQSGEAD